MERYLCDITKEVFMKHSGKKLLCSLLLAGCLLLTLIPVTVQAAVTYGLNQAWKVDGNWEVKVTNVQKHYRCMEETAYGEQYVLVTVQVKDLGYARKNGYPLYLIPNEVYDQYGDLADGWGCPHSTVGHELSMTGSVTNMVLGYVLPKNSTSITLHFSEYDSNDVLREAVFKVNIGSSAPKFAWNSSHINGDNEYQYTLNQTWKENGNWEVKVTSVKDHSSCSSLAEDILKGEKAVQIDFTYKNIGFKEDGGKLTMSPIEVYDEFGNAGEFLYNCEHWINSEPVSLNKTGSGRVCFSIPRSSKYVFVFFEGMNNNGDFVHALYKLAVGNGTLPVNVTKVTLNQSSVYLNVGKTTTLKATVTPTNATNKNVTWKSSDTSVATVSSSGLVTAKAGGVATITAMAKDGSGKSASCTVYVPVAPKLVAIYNSAKGADIRWVPQNGVKTYYIMRKLNGVWSVAAAVSASSLTKEGGNYKYIDTSVALNYGQGYIYSVAVAKDSSGTPLYDKRGLPLYRLKQPTITSVTAKGNGVVEVKWTKENCQGYEVQYSDNNGSNWKKAKEVTPGTVVSQKIDGLKKGTTYVFRIRCQKTNKDRGRTWSQYSAWKKCVVK